MKRKDRNELILSLHKMCARIHTFPSFAYRYIALIEKTFLSMRYIVKRGTEKKERKDQQAVKSSCISVVIYI